MKNKTGILFIAACYTFFLLPLTPLWAQTSDTTTDVDIFAPIIQHDLPEKAIKANTPLRFKAYVVDNGGVAEVLLFYRTAGQEDFSAVRMLPFGKETYTVLISETDIAAPGFEYYIQASDQPGNTSFMGNFISPLEIIVEALPVPEQEEALVPPEKPVLETPVKQVTEEIKSPTLREPIALRTGTSLEKPWYKKWWVWAIAVAVVGGAVATGSGGGSDSNSTSSGTGTTSIAGPLP